MYLQFHAGNCESILFKSIKVTTGEQFASAAVIIFIIAIAYEGLRFWREKLHNDYTTQNAQSCQSSTKDGPPARKTIRYTMEWLCKYLTANNFFFCKFRQLLTQKIHLIQTLMHMIQVTVSYALMLIVMTYNVWLVLAVILGATVGFFFFGWIRQRSIDVADNCCH